MSPSKKWTCKGILLQVFICLRSPSLLGFCLGWSTSFVGSQYKTLATLAEYGLQQNPIPPPPPPPVTHCISISIIQYTYSHKGGGELNQRGGGRGATGESKDHKAGSKIPT